MASEPQSSEQLAVVASRMGGIGFVVLWLLFLYFITVSFVILSLSAFQVHKKVRDFSDGDRSYSIGEMVNLLNEWDLRKRRVADAIARVASAQEDVGTANNTLQELKSANEDNFDLYLEQENRINRALAKAEKSTFSDWGDIAIIDVITNVEERLEILNAGEELNQIRDEFINKSDDYSASNRKLEEAERRLGIAEAALADSEKKLKLVRTGSVVVSAISGQTDSAKEDKQLGESERGDGVERRAALLGSLVDIQESLQKPGVQNLLNELIFVRSFFFGLVYEIVAIPSEVLTLILTLAMGALGSVIYLTRRFLSKAEPENIYWYFFRPFLGMITALAVFVLAKAGVLMVAESPAAAGSTGDLNPFFISFLAIISGLLSEQAVRRIQSAGESFFRVESDTETAEAGRWAPNLKAEIEQQQKSIEDLGGYVNLDRATIQAWVNEEEAVPAAKQDIVAAWLGKAKRTLFTDLAPPSRNLRGSNDGKT